MHLFEFEEKYQNWNVLSEKCQIVILDLIWVWKVAVNRGRPRLTTWLVIKV